MPSDKKNEVPTNDMYYQYERCDNEPVKYCCMCNDPAKYEYKGQYHCEKCYNTCGKCNTYDSHGLIPCGLDDEQNELWHCYHCAINYIENRMYELAIKLPIEERYELKRIVCLVHTLKSHPGGTGNAR